MDALSTSICTWNIRPYFIPLNFIPCKNIVIRSQSNSEAAPYFDKLSTGSILGDIMQGW